MAKAMAKGKYNETGVVIPVGNVSLRGILGLPDHPPGIVLFAHGSGSGRLSPRNTFVARSLQDWGIATLLMDLLDEAEAKDGDKVFDIDLLADRLLAGTEWAKGQAGTKALKVGYFGASTGAAAALQAAARIPERVSAVVSRGGRPDLAPRYLHLVRAPTLLIVGGEDWGIIPLNERAYDTLECEKDLRVVPGATHLFEEPGALETVAELARNWFLEHFERKKVRGAGFSRRGT